PDHFGGQEPFRPRPPHDPNRQSRPALQRHTQAHPLAKKFQTPATPLGPTAPTSSLCWVSLDLKKLVSSQVPNHALDGECYDTYEMRGKGCMFLCLSGGFCMAAPRPEAPGDVGYEVCSTNHGYPSYN